MNVGKHLKIINHDVTYIGARKNDEINNRKFQKKLTKKSYQLLFSNLFYFSLPTPS